MRAFAGWFLVLATFGPSVGADEGQPWPPDHHAAPVVAVEWTPREPARGQDLLVRLELGSSENVTQVLLRACRVQAYACLAPSVMAAEGDALHYRGTIGWDSAFFDRVERVGVAFTVRFADGNETQSPSASWPGHPVELPDGAGEYYFYALPPQAPGSPGPGVLAVAAAALFVLLAWRRPA